MLHKTSDGCVVDGTGKVIFFSEERFLRDVVEGDRCFICGADPREVPFNAEHVLPDWILHRFNLIGRDVTLPNGSKLRYDRYKTPCCVQCNQLMGREIEGPISRLVDQGRDAIYAHVEQHGTLLFYVWLALIFLKTHLKDRQLRIDRDLRSPDMRIGDLYEWRELHHLHTVVRCFYSGSELRQGAVGSLVVLPITQQVSNESFDFADLSSAQTLLLRIADVAFLAVFNDSVGSFSAAKAFFDRITGPLSEVQLRECMVELAFMNLHLKQRPTFLYGFDDVEERHWIGADTPPMVELQPLDHSVRGRLMVQALGEMTRTIEIRNTPRHDFRAALEAGSWSFVLDDHGNFIAN